MDKLQQVIKDIKRDFRKEKQSLVILAITFLILQLSLEWSDFSGY